MALRPTPAGPIDAHDALDGTEARLLELLDELSHDDWTQPTIVPGWQVRHVAGHLLDTALRRLSVARDGLRVDAPASADAADLRAFIDRMNGEGVTVYGRLSPAALRLLMAPASEALRTCLRARRPDDDADFAVSWAGQVRSPHWFDVARELTERWHHQQQIRLALDRPGLMTRPLYHPVLDCFMRVLPWRYRDLDAPEGTHLAVRVTGEAGDTWHLVRAEGAWVLTTDDVGAPTVRVTVPDHVAWRLFTKGLTAAAAERSSRIEGDRTLALPLFTTTAIVG